MNQDYSNYIKSDKDMTLIDNLSNIEKLYNDLEYKLNKYEKFNEELVRKEDIKRFTDQILLVIKFIENNPEINEQLIQELIKDNAQILINYIPFEDFEFLINRLPKDSLQALREIYSTNCEFEIDQLRFDHSSSKANEKILFFEEAIRFLDKAKFLDDEATIAGNLAGIFRRKRDREKTFYYHKLSSQLYKNEGKLRDYMIEFMNLATAYLEFGDLETAKELLKGLFILAINEGIRDIAAYSAGNLAHMILLNDQITVAENNLVKECFRVEEEYARKSKNYHELAISLFNQINYYLSLEKLETLKIKDKYEELNKIVNENHLFEFFQPLEELEKLMRNIIGPFEDLEIEEEDLKRKFKELTKENEFYQHFLTLTERPDMIVALLKNPISDSLIESNLFLTLNINDGYYVLIQLDVLIDKENLNTQLLEEYVKWNNSFNDITMSFEHRPYRLNMGIKFYSNSWEEVKKVYRYTTMLFGAETVLIAELESGNLELEEMKEKKLRLIREQDE